MVQVGVPVEGGTAGASSGVDGFLFHQFDAAAVGEPDERDVEPFGHVGDHEDVFRLSGDPGAGHDFVVKADDDGPFAFDLADAVDDAGTPFFVVTRVVEGVQR